MGTGVGEVGVGRGYNLSNARWKGWGEKLEGKRKVEILGELERSRYGSSKWQKGSVP